MIQTLADFPEIAVQYGVHWGEPWDPTLVLFVHAPCCGRKTAADTVFDVRHVTGTIVSPGGTAPASEHDWLCDGCRQRLEAGAASNGWTASRFLEACGAHPDTVRAHRIGEIAHAVELADHAAGKAHSIEGTRAVLEAQFPR